MLLLLTIDRVDSNSRCAPRNAARYKRHIERSGPIYTSLTQLIQVGKKREIDDGERNIPAQREKKTDDESDSFHLFAKKLPSNYVLPEQRGPEAFIKPGDALFSQ